MSLLAGMLRFDSVPMRNELLAPVVEMLTDLPHDDLKIDCEGPVGLAWLSLRVTDEDALDRQPLPDARSGTRILFDGRLDNREELCKLLDMSVEQSRQLPDSHFALQAYLRWGRDCCKHLAGDFAFVVWSARDQTLSLFRDHIGIRPLYYSFIDNYFAFSSHLGSLAKLPGVNTAIDEYWLADYLSLTHLDARRTAYQGIRKLRPAHGLQVSLSGSSQGFRYWQLSDDARDAVRLSPDDYENEFRARLDRAVRVRLRGSGPVASMLSGGLDSSVLTALSARATDLNGRKLFAVSSVLPEDYTGPETDEREYIQALLGGYPGIDWCPVAAAGRDILSDVGEMFAAYGQPSRDFMFYMTHALMRESSNQSARTLMTGFGGDFFVSAKLHDAMLALLLRGRIGAVMGIAGLEAREQSRPLAAALRSGLYSQLGARLRYTFGYEGFRAVKDTPPMDRTFVKRVGLANRIRGFLRTQRGGWLHTLEDEQQRLSSGVFDEAVSALVASGNYHGLSLVMPMLDKAVISWVANMPLHVRSRWGRDRSLLRHVFMPVLPSLIGERTSKGPFVPDMTRRNYAAIGQGLPAYRAGDKIIPSQLDWASIETAANHADAVMVGWHQDISTIKSVIAPLLYAEFYSRKQTG